MKPINILHAYSYSLLIASFSVFGISHRSITGFQNDIAARMDTGNMNTNEPDADSIKLFIGQIPKDITEDELKEMFQGYGPIYQLNKVKDKVTNEHKGERLLSRFKTEKRFFDVYQI